MDYIMAFLVGGLICAAGQILMDFTPLSPAHVLVVFVTLGAILSGLGLYQPLIDLAGAGASVPLPGFGHTLVKGVIEEVNKSGALGILTGGLKATAAGITAAIVFGYIMALIFNPKPK
ncbi:stage V sporulation protein AE [Caldanaerovirga acetigignens]|uniref:stage V sporulation protein AE n=1 Tax=Caldanaerovirga acetigignens TaxID=447595 RepID=UPI0009338950|nr:stage V sporulation protein AE [Caldanaerovirga acetigignens]